MILERARALLPGVPVVSEEASATQSLRAMLISWSIRSMEPASWWPARDASSV